ncbi:MAG: HD domain-containing protein [Oscillochloridaceae bacterium umkhey_bin13]
MMNNDLLTTTLHDLATFWATRGVTAWLVGGAVRDLVRGKTPLDLDLAVTGDGFELARAYADARQAAFVPLDAERATGRIVLPGPPPLTLDVAGLRGPTIEADLRLRDLTINALAVPLSDAAVQRTPPAPREGEGGRGGGGEAGRPASDAAVQRTPPAPREGEGAEGILPALIDPTGGLADLRAGRLRSCGPNSLLDDPLRVVRVARFAAQLGWQPMPELVTQMKAAAGKLGVVAHERIREELLRLLDAPASAPSLRLLDQTGALTGIFPELAAARDCAQPRVHFLPVLAHSLETVAALDWLTTVIMVGDTSRLPAEALPVAVQTHPALATTIPYASQLATLLNERRAGGHRRVALLKLAGLLHDNAKPQTKINHPDGSVTFYGHQEQGAAIALNIARRLRLARPDAALVALIVREHMRPGQLRTSGPPTPRALARLFRDFGDATPEVLLHELADHLASRGPHTDPAGWEAHLAWFGAILTRYYRPVEERQPPLLTGHDLINELGLSPGPQLGTLLREVAEAQAADEITSRDEAMALVRKLL